MNIKSNRSLLTVLIILLSINYCYAQPLLISTAQGKNCRIDISSGPVSNNFFGVSLNSTWVTAQLMSVFDTASVVCIDRDQLIKNLPKSLRLTSPTSSKIISFNSSVILTFELDEMFKGGNVSINFPFTYASSKTALADPNAIQEFPFKRPKNFAFSMDVKDSIIVHKIPPRIIVTSPENIDEGLKPIVDTPNIKIQIYALDAVGIERVTINSIPAIQVNDTAFFANISLKVGFENPITVVAFDKKGLFSNKQFSVECKKPDVTMVISGYDVLPSKNRKPSDIDIEIPEIPASNPNRFALIIGNEDYSTFQTSLKTESNVEYAIHDAEIFKEYALKIIGIPADNIIMVTNAKAIEMHQAIDQTINIIKNMQGKAELFVYYAGHGFPDEQTKEPFLIPVDVTGTGLQYAIKQTDFFKKITEFPSKRVVVFLDACFSGGGRNQGLLASRGVKIKPKENALKGNMVVFSASSGEQSSLPYKEKQHGLFTYFLLKKLKETQGDINFKDLADYLTFEIPVRSVMINNKEQNPQTRVSYELGDSWQSWTIR
jgi:uncharacterized caspase-like protein